MTGALLPQFTEGLLVPETPRPNWGPVIRRIELAREYASDPVLDCGAGTGWLTMHLASWGFDVTATDFDERAMNNFRRNMEIAGIDCSVHREDITKMSLPDGAYGSVFCFSVLEHIADLDAALGELHRVMAHDGVLVAGVPNSVGAYSLLNDHDIRSAFRRKRRGDIRQDHENLHPSRWWQSRLSEYFTVERSLPLEVLSPVIAKLFGYSTPLAVTRADVSIARRLPRFFASDVIFVARKT